TEQAQEQFQSAYRNFQVNLAQEVERTARNIYEQLQKKPATLYSIRGIKLAFDLGTIGATVAAGGIHWHDVTLVPLVASLTHQLVELLGKQVVDAEREATRQRQQALFRQYLSTPLAEWLIQWPSTGGSAFERLQKALRRLPESIAQIEARAR